MATAVSVATTLNDGIHVPDDGFGVAAPIKFATTIRFVDYFGSSPFALKHTALFDYDQWRKWSFFQTADTVAPYIGRKTVYPSVD